MRPPTYYARRLTDLETEYDQQRDEGDLSAASDTTNAIHF